MIIERLDPQVARILRAKSGMERLRLAHEAWELALDRLAFPAVDFYVSEDAARDALAARPVQRHPRRIRRDDRRVHRQGHRVRPGALPATATSAARPGRDAYFARSEDVILDKLLYFSQGGSDRHLRDVAGVLAVSGSVIDVAYVSRWATARGVGGLWNAARGGQTAV